MLNHNAKDPQILLFEDAELKTTYNMEDLTRQNFLKKIKQMEDLNRQNFLKKIKNGGSDQENPSLSSPWHPFILTV